MDKETTDRNGTYHHGSRIHFLVNGSEGFLIQDSLHEICEAIWLDYEELAMTKVQLERIT